jgi:amidohydrolase
VIAETTQQEMTGLRRELHRNPEMSGRETRTAAKICEVLDRLGIPYQAGVAGTGVIAEIAGQQPGSFIALRADMDALPIQEQTDLPFASVTPGVMHACGHDGHVAMLLGAAMELLLGNPPPLPVRLLFQPAEETAEGAQEMIRAGALEEVALIFGGHLDVRTPVGTITVGEGVMGAAYDSFRIEITGRGGHAARPHEAIDALAAGSAMVQAIQGMASNPGDPVRPSVITVGRFQAGSAPNVIAGAALLEGSIRTLAQDQRAELHRGIRQEVEAVAERTGAQVQIEFRARTPVLINEPEPTALARESAVAVVTEAGIRGVSEPNMGSEDFGYYLERIRGCYVRFGAAPEAREAGPSHSGRFDFNERALTVGAAYFATVARRAGQWIQAGGEWKKQPGTR